MHTSYRARMRGLVPQSHSPSLSGQQLLARISHYDGASVLGRSCEAFWAMPRGSVDLHAEHLRPQQAEMWLPGGELQARLPG